MSAQHTPRVRRLWVPLTFWIDHADRCPCDDAEADMAFELRIVGSRALIEAYPRQIETLRRDAEFYAEGNVDDCPGLVRSARATLAAIAKVTGSAA